MADSIDHRSLHCLFGQLSWSFCPLLSADAMAGQIRRLKAAGAAAYLTKPLDVGQVLALLDELLTIGRP